MQRTGGRKTAGAASPHSLGQARLAESGLNGADIKALGLSFLNPKQTAALGEEFAERPAIRIPYHDAKGKATGFYRLRYLGDAPGFEGATKKQRRYAQATGTRPELYMPRGVPWDKIAKTPGMNLWLTEGEFKAAAACKAGIACLGLGGVYSWKSARAGQPLIPALEYFDWQGREVRLAFDSDLRTNPQVLRALLALSRELAHRGAKMFMVELPDAKNGEKQGLDDFLVARGKAALAKLGEEATPYTESEELWKMSAEVVYIKDPGLVVVLEDGRKMAPRGFKEHAYANRFFWETQLAKDGSPSLVKKPLAPAWLAWEQRAELSRITYAPGAERVTQTGEYNYWPGWGCEPKRGDVSLWRELLDYIFKGDAVARKWFEQWCAYPIQHPGAKLYTASVVWGVQTGTGKSLIGYSLGRIYGKNFTEVNDQDIASPFNEWAENRQFVMGDDVAGSEHKKGTADRLKSMITRLSMRLNPKYVPSYTVPDCINYYFNSQHPDAFFLDDKDRRYFVWEAPMIPQPQTFYDRYDKWMMKGDGASALFYHLLRVDMDGFQSNMRAPMTLAKAAMSRDSKSDLADWVYRLRESPETMLRVGGAEIEGDLFTTGRLLALYDPEGKGRVTANGLGRELKKVGFQQVHGGSTIQTKDGPQRLYAIRNAKKWLSASLNDMQKHMGWTGDAPVPKAKQKRKKF